MGTKKTGEQTYEVKYTGQLMDSENVYLHFGYTNWSDVSEKKMRKLKTCYKAEVVLPAETEFNFCFRDEANKWDNNYGNNYFFMPGSTESYEWVEIIDKEPKTTVKTPATKTKSVVATSKTKTTKKTATTKKEK